MTTTDIMQADDARVAMTYELMRPLLHEVFQLAGEQWAGTEVTLVEVEKIAEKKPVVHSWQKQPVVEDDVEQVGKRVSFTLVFRFPVGCEATQRIYEMAHPVVGAFEGTFLVPIAEDEGGRYLEAVFNFLTK